MKMVSRSVILYLLHSVGDPLLEAGPDTLPVEFAREAHQVIVGGVEFVDLLGPLAGIADGAEKVERTFYSESGDA